MAEGKNVKRRFKKSTISTVFCEDWHVKGGKIIFTLSYEIIVVALLYVVILPAFARLFFYIEALGLVTAHIQG